MRFYSLIQRVIPIALSLSLLGLAVLAAWVTLPGGGKTPRADTLAIPESSFRWSSVNPNIAIPIFLFDDDFFPLQCGRAAPMTVSLASTPATDTQALELRPFRSGGCPGIFADDTAFSLQPASLRLLWTLLPLTAREQLTQEAWSSARGLSMSIADAFNSEHYYEVYRPELLAIVQAALQRVGTDPALQERVVQAIHELSPRYLGRFVDDLWPIAREQASNKIWENLWSTAGSIIGMGGSSEGGSLTSRILQAILDDPRGQELAFRYGLEVLAEPELAALGNEISRAVVTEILRDPQFAALTDRILLDPELFPDGHRIRFDFAFLVRELPRQLLRYRHPQDHNPLVAYLARSIVRGDSRFVILGLTAAQSDQAKEQGMARGVGLTLIPVVPAATNATPPL